MQDAQDVWYWLIWIVYIILLVVIAEVFSYLWHRWAAHTDIIPGLHDTHRIHHQAGVDYHTAGGDFIWIIGLVLILTLGLSLGVYWGFFTTTFVVVTIIIVLLVFLTNYYIHASYHKPGHWLNNYQWFRDHKVYHLLHHQHPDKNFGIVTFYPDQFGGTFTST